MEMLSVILLFSVAALPLRPNDYCGGAELNWYRGLNEHFASFTMVVGFLSTVHFRITMKLSVIMFGVLLFCA